MLQCTQPILTAICSFIILRETMSLRGILGGLTIISAILVVNLLETNEKPDKATKNGDKDYIGESLSAEI
jgi:drug/metabolite transporter (DMT)-like permease